MQKEQSRKIWPKLINYTYIVFSFLLASDVVHRIAFSGQNFFSDDLAKKEAAIVIGLAVIYTVVFSFLRAADDDLNWYNCKKTTLERLVPDRKLNAITLLNIFISASIVLGLLAASLSETSDTQRSALPQGPFLVIAAAIGAFAAIFAQHVNAFSNTMTKSRQEWINNLRNEATGYFNTAFTLMITFQSTAKNNHDTKDHIRLLSKMNRHETKIRLLMNQTEADHELFIEKMKILNTISCQDEAATEESVKNIRNLHDEMAKLMQKILKREWERIKKVQ